MLFFSSVACPRCLGLGSMNREIESFATSLSMMPGPALSFRARHLSYGGAGALSEEPALWLVTDADRIHPG